MRTYIPRNNSLMRKNLPIFSPAGSLSSYHCFGVSKRKPVGGGPLGVANLAAEVEKEAIEGRNKLPGRIEALD